MVTARAVAVLIILVMMVMVFMLVVVMTALTVVVMMLVIVMAALTVVVVFMIVVVMTALTVVAVMLVMMVMSVFFKLLYVLGQRFSLLHRLDHLISRKHIPRGSYYDCRGIMSPQKLDTFMYFLIGYFCGVTQNYAPRIFNLIVKELAKILHMHFAFVRVHDRCKSVENSAVSVGIFNRTYYVGELTDTGRLYKNSVGSIFRYYFLKCR
jgi:hypothetical protein